ncbi:hypothetical protein BGZ46_010433 [Entomortierella lignicola]|nr:hypothetical protein BGZ46_010433 [Entomortierella lignicola]
MEKSDEDLARLLQEQEYMNTTGSATWQNEASNNSPFTIPDDDTHELLFDLNNEGPFKDLHQLFLVFNDQYFESKLSACEVRWSSRMTRCAGLCYYQSKAQYCSIRLSEPLLKFRPESDYIDTLLHEMIHAYLFVTQAIQDHDGHGADFQYHMNRINKAAGTSISIYHTFHDEVRHYQNHIWKCNGPCQTRPPYYGIVKRSMNRPPQPADKWFAEHKETCGGTYTKISEPEPTKKKTSTKTQKKIELEARGRTLMDEYFSVPISSEAGSLSRSRASPSPNEQKRNGIGIVEIARNPRLISDVTKPKLVIDLDSDEHDERPSPRAAAAAAAIRRYEQNSKSGEPSTVTKPDSPLCKRKDPGIAGVITVDDQKSKRSKSDNTTPIKDGRSELIDIRDFTQSKSLPITLELNRDGGIRQVDLEGHETLFKGSIIAANKTNDTVARLVQCPVCSQEVEEPTINDHVDLCIWKASGNTE